MEKEYDVIVVGSGAGGATVAREMALKGKKVLVLEMGGHIKKVGSTLSAALMSKEFGNTRSKEKTWVVSCINYGGTSNLAAGCAVPPPKMIFNPLGIELSEEADEAKKEMWIGKLPDELVGETNLRLIEAANDLGYNWGKFEKFIDPEKCIPDCSDCMMGCKRGAKWTARIYGDEAIENGTELVLRTKIDRVLVENGKAIGVEGKNRGKKVRYYGKVVVLSAAMENTPVLLRSGIEEAGKGFACDYLQFVGGIGKNINTLKANPMSVGTMEHYESDGIVIMPVFPNWASFFAGINFMGPRYMSKFFKFWKYTGIMVKIRDDIEGEIYADGSFSKPISGEDQRKLDKGVDIITKVLMKVGCKADSIFVMDPMGAHPSASCRIGEVVDKNLETRIKSLFCCDSSVLPSALGLPLVWTLVSLGKRLSKHLCGVTH